MKLSLIITLVTSMSVSASIFSQDLKLDLAVEKMPIKEVLKVLESKTPYRFFYSDDFKAMDQTISLNLENITINAVLQNLFKETSASYKIMENNIVVISPFSMLQQNITGVVTDAGTGEPLPGVNVIVEGTTVGATTDINGKFTLEAPLQGKMLVFSYMGYLSETIPFTGQSVVNIALTPDIKNLEEVVVIGYGTQKKGDVTSSVASIKQKDFIQGNVKDVGQLIQGKVSGLTIYSVSGDPTSNTQIKLRGNSTISATNSNPLILIDNIPGDFNSVAPEDIESVDVLKDGSSAAIYGTQGTNGVILITTKRASGKSVNSVEYSGYTSTQTIARALGMSNAADVRQQITDGYRSASDDHGANTDWLKEITRTPISHVHNLTFRGGSMQTNYLFNVNYKNLQGVFLKSNNKVANMRADVNHTMLDGLIKINIGALTRYVNYNTSGDGASFNGYTYRQAVIYNPTAPVKNPDGSWYEEIGAFNYDNPVSRLEESDGKNSSQWSRYNATITVQPLKSLKLSALLSYSKYNEVRGYFESKNHISTLRGGLNGYASNGTAESVDRLAELTTEYTKSLNKHNFKLLGGYSYKENEYREFWERNVDFPSGIFGYSNIGLGNGIAEANPNAGIGGSRSITNLIAFFGRSTYNYNDKYLFMGSLRYEAASTLVGTNNPWGLFPAVSVGWRVSNESFMKDLELVNDLKLRIGYGVTGSQPTSLFLGMAAMSYGGTFYSDGKWKQTLSPSRNANPHLKWEEKKETNIGLDFGLFNSRINGTIDYYNRQIDGLLFNYEVPMPPNLVQYTMANVGKMENKGVEVLVNIVPIRNKDIEWTTSFNFSTNKNKLVTLSNDLYKNTTGFINDGYTGEPIQTFTHRVDVGGKIGNFYGFKVVDISEEGRWIYEDKQGNKVNSEDFARVDSNKMVLGNGLPKFYMGWNNTFRYKKFDLSISMRGAFGFQLLNFERMYLENTQTTAYNRLRSAYDKVFDKAVLSEVEDLEFNSYYVEDGDYWKIDNITLGYNFKLGKFKYIKSARVYISSLNTLTITQYKGIDPEVQIDGLEPGNDYRDKYPTTRTFTIGCNLNF